MASSTCASLLPKRRSLVVGILQRPLSTLTESFGATSTQQRSSRTLILTRGATPSQFNYAYYSTRVSSEKLDNNDKAFSATRARVAQRKQSDTSIQQTAAFDFDPQTLVHDLHDASAFVPRRDWDPGHIRSVVDRYERHLIYIYNHLQTSATLEDFISDKKTLKATQLLLSSATTEKAFVCITKAKIHTYQLSQMVRDWERYIGKIGLTELTHGLTFQLLQANAKAGNVGRVLTLLELRRNAPVVHELEYKLAVLSIDAAGLYLRKNRNIFVGDDLQPAIDNPTRWLDSILINMQERKVPLTTELANRMLHTYCSSGRSGKALHFFYNVRRHDAATVDGVDTNDDMPKGAGRRPVKVGLKHNTPPPFHKVPSQAKGLVFASSGSSDTDNEDDIPQRRMTKLERESQSDWSVPLQAAFTFLNSLTLGACGHDPITPDLSTYNTLIKVCCYRGSIWRAIEVLNETIPNAGFEPDVYSYNSILSALARVGDVETCRELFLAMSNSPTLQINDFTVQAMVEAYCNVGDVSGAITLVQDVFNQHSTLPPYTTHLAILEFALSSKYEHEAKRHLYFVQQLWKWKPSRHDSPSFCRLMELTQKNPKLSKDAMIKLFRYFGYKLSESDFF